MNKISIGFSTKKTWDPVSALIRLVEGSRYSHVFVTWKCTNIRRRKVFEAVGSGIRILSNVNFKKKSKIVELYHFEVDDATLFRIEQKAHDLTGKPYGYSAILGLGWMRMMGFFYRVFNINKKPTNPFKDGDYSQVCVEAGGMVLAEITKLPMDFENWGVREMNDKAKELGQRVSQEKIDRINGVK